MKRLLTIALSTGATVIALATAAAAGVKWR